MANTRKERTVEARLNAIVPNGNIRAVPGYGATATNQAQMMDEMPFLIDFGMTAHSSATTSVSVGGKVVPFDFKIVGAIVPVEDGFGTSSATARTLTVGTRDDPDAFVDDYIFATDTATGALNIFSTATEWVSYEGNAGEELIYGVQQTTTATAGRTGLVLVVVPRA